MDPLMNISLARVNICIPMNRQVFSGGGCKCNWKGWPTKGKLENADMVGHEI